ncbi:MAG: sugar ABC transporter permease [Actinobacteria bacterium]|nr:sugar ABC transporter permease [Actinomycetota bacterium]
MIKCESTKKYESLRAYLFILPSVLIIGLIILYPIYRVIYLSFFNISFVTKDPSFIGFANYLKAIRSYQFWKVVKNSAIWTILVVALQNLFGFSFAVFFNRKNLIGQSFMRSLVLISWVIPGVIVGVIWKLMFNPQIGLINSLLLRVGIIDEYVAFLANERTAMIAVIVVAIWKGFPFSFVMYLAALQHIRKDLSESAMIDGANYFQRIIHVIIPQISGVIRITLLFTTIWTFNYFDIIYTMTKGGPNRSTQIFPVEIYDQAFSQLKFSYASSIAVLSLIAILILSQFYIRELRKTGAM